MKCIKCGSENPEGSIYCKDCGSKIEVIDETPKGGKVVLVIVVLVLLSLIGISIYFTAFKDKKNSYNPSNNGSNNDNGNSNLVFPTSSDDVKIISKTPSICLTTDVSFLSCVKENIDGGKYYSDSSLAAFEFNKVSYLTSVSSFTTKDSITTLDDVTSAEIDNKVKVTLNGDIVTLYYYENNKEVEYQTVSNVKKFKQYSTDDTLYLFLVNDDVEVYSLEINKTGNLKKNLFARASKGYYYDVVLLSNYKGSFYFLGENNRQHYFLDNDEYYNKDTYKTFSRKVSVLNNLDVVVNGKKMNTASLIIEKDSKPLYIIGTDNILYNTDYEIVSNSTVSSVFTYTNKELIITFNNGTNMFISNAAF